MVDTKILYIAVPRGQDRLPCVSQKEWAAIFSEYPDSLRYHAANLAAHNWDVVMIEGRVLIACPWSGGHWIDKDGSRQDLSSEELDAFYPRSDKRGEETTYDRDIKSYRLRKIVMPTPPPQTNVAPIGWATVRVEDTCDGLLINADDMKRFGLRYDVQYEGHFLPDGRYRIAIPSPAPEKHVGGCITPQAIRQTAAWECIEEELRDELRRAADALEASEKEAIRLRKMVERRDEFIIGNGLWDEFKGASHEAE